MSDIGLTFAILVAAVVLFMSGRVPVGLVAIGVSLALWATGVLSLEQALAGFGDPAVIFIAALFVVSEGLDASGISAWVGQQMVQRAGESRTRLVVLTMAVCAVLTAFISVNGAVAALLSVAVVMAVRLGRPPSQLLLPLVFAAHAGSMLALTGTPVNILVSEAAADAGGTAFGFFEFALAGIPLLIGTVIVVVLLGPRVIPKRTPAYIPPDLSQHARVLVEHYRPPWELTPEAAQHGLLTSSDGLAEVVVPPRSALIGTKAYAGMVTESGDLVVLAVQRAGDDLGPEPATLAAGDVLLLRGTWEALDVNLTDPEVLVVDSPSAIRRQAVPLGRGAPQAIAILLAMVAALVTGVIPSVVAGLLAAGAMILFRVITVREAHRGIAWTTVILVAGMLPMAAAMTQTGAAKLVADTLIGLVGDFGPIAVLAGLFLVTVVFGQLISNMATALIVIPVGISAATDLGLSVQPVMMSITVAAAAAYLTPIATPVNLMVMDPAGYRFGDYWKLGLPLLVVSFVVSVLLVPVIWPF